MSQSPSPCFNMHRHGSWPQRAIMSSQRTCAGHTIDKFALVGSQTVLRVAGCHGFLAVLAQVNFQVSVFWFLYLV